VAVSPEEFQWECSSSARIARLPAQLAREAPADVVELTWFISKRLKY